jgi:hypothetical protein
VESSGIRWNFLCNDEWENAGKWRVTHGDPGPPLFLTAKPGNPVVPQAVFCSLSMAAEKI